MSGDRAGQQGWRDGSTPPPVFAGQPIARQFEAGGLVPSAPRYLPTEEQFRDPLAFVAAIRAEAEPYGVCSIRPPPSWAPPYAIDRATFTFKTRLQCIHELYDRGGSGCQHWRAAYNKFLATSGLRHTKKQNPTLHGAVIDLAKLHRAVQRRGGYQAVIDAKKWKEVARIAGVGAPANSLPPCASPAPPRPPSTPPLPSAPRHAPPSLMALHVRGGRGVLSIGVR